MLIPDIVVGGQHHELFFVEIAFRNILDVLHTGAGNRESGTFHQLLQMVAFAGRPLLINNKTEAVLKAHSLDGRILQLLLERAGHSAEVHLLKLGHSRSIQHHFDLP